MPSWEPRDESKGGGEVRFHSIVCKRVFNVPFKELLKGTFTLCARARSVLEICVHLVLTAHVTEVGQRTPLPLVQVARGRCGHSEALDPSPLWGLLPWTLVIGAPVCTAGPTRPDQGHGPTVSCTVSMPWEPRAHSLFSLPPLAGLWPHGVPSAPSCFPMLTVPCSAGLAGRALPCGSVPRPAWFVAWPCGERAGSAVGGEPPSWLSPLHRFTRRFPSLTWLVLWYGPGARQHPLAGGLRTSGADCG